jgi:hypothetical protein
MGEPILAEGDSMKKLIYGWIFLGWIGGMLFGCSTPQLTATRESTGTVPPAMTSVPTETSSATETPVAQQETGNAPVGVPIIPNASSITARILSVEAVQRQGVPQDVFLLVLDVLTSKPEGGEMSFVEAGQQIEAYSKEDLSNLQAGQVIEGVISLRGDEHGQAFWITQVKLVPGTAYP